MKILKVDYIPQININACGAAVLEMIYKYYDLQGLSQQDLMEKYKELEPHGSGNFMLSTDNLVLDARSKGLNAGWIRANWQDRIGSISLLRVLVDSGVPVIVCQKFTEGQPLIGHFRIVLGIDEEKVCLHDPSVETGGANIEWTVEKFMDFWKPTGQNVTGGILVFISK